MQGFATLVPTDNRKENWVKVREKYNIKMLGYVKKMCLSVILVARGIINNIMFVIWKSTHIY